MSRRPFLHRALFALPCLLLVASAHPAWAGEPADLRLAQALFDEGRLLMEKKRYAEACPKLAESQRLDPGGGTLLNLAICHEKEGKVATAAADYEEALAVAMRDGRKDRQVIARERLGVVEALAPKLSVNVGAASDLGGLEVKVDGLVLKRAAWGLPVRVDPGAHIVEASAPGRGSWSTPLTLERSQKKNVDVPVLGPLSALPGITVVSGLGVATPNATAPDGGERPMIIDESAAPVLPPAPYSTASSRGHANPLFYTALTVTLAASTTSLVTGVLAFRAKQSATTGGCLADRAYCRDQTSVDAADQARTMAWVSTLTLGAAVLGAVGMIVFPRRTAGDPAVRAAALPGGGALGLVGAF